MSSADDALKRAEGATAPETPLPAKADPREGDLEKIGGVSLRALRAAVETRLSAMDIGSLIMQGALVQEVMIYKGLTVSFRTPTAEEEDWVNGELLRLGRMSERGFNHVLMELGLTVGIEKLNGVTWPLATKQGSIDPETIATRRERVRALPDVLLMFLSINQTWFNERVTAMISAEVVGNG